MFQARKLFVYLTLFAFLVFHFIAIPAGSSESLREEALALYKLETDYMKKSISNNWEGIYAYQHPLFRKKISLDEFKFFNGKVEHNYRSNLRARVSGGYAIPSLDYIRENRNKKDILGNPAIRKYSVTTSPMINIKDFEIKSVAVSPNNKRAKISVRLKGTMRLDPGVVQMSMNIPYNNDSYDYWEKNNGKWSIALLTDTRHISGNAYFYFLPGNKKLWNDTKFKEFPKKQLIKDKL